MGLAKERMIQEDEQGWKFEDGKSVCDRCFDEPTLKATELSEQTRWFEKILREMVGLREVTEL